MALKAVNPKGDPFLAAKIVGEAREEFPTVKPNGNAQNGFSRRIRNRLMAEAGVQYNEALELVRGLMA